LIGASGDGRYVAFSTDAPDLTGLPNNGKFQVYLRDMQTGQTRMVSTNTTGTAGSGPSSP